MAESLAKTLGVGDSGRVMSLLFADVAAAIDSLHVRSSLAARCEGWETADIRSLAKKAAAVAAKNGNLRGEDARLVARSFLRTAELRVWKRNTGYKGNRYRLTEQEDGLTPWESYCLGQEQDRVVKPEFGAALDVQELLSRIPTRSRSIVWRVLAEGWTLSEVGDKEGLTKERVRQIVNEALAIMRRAANYRHP